MKILILVSGYLILAINSHSQKNGDPISLYRDIIQYGQVETKHIGCYGVQSTLFKKIDSLKQLIGAVSFINYYSDSSHILKYYSFLALLSENDNYAFEKLVKSINDTTMIDFNFAGQNRGTTSFNSLIASEYITFIKYKYYYGVSCTIKGQSYVFNKKDRRMWKLKENEFYRVINDSSIDKEFIKSYSG